MLGEGFGGWHGRCLWFGLLSFRKELRKSGTEFANIIGISQGSLSDIERGKTKPSAKAIIGLIQKTNIDIRWLLTGERTNETSSQKVINPLLDYVNDWLNDERKHKDSDFCTLFRQQMVRAFFDYERWLQKREETIQEPAEVK